MKYLSFIFRQPRVKFDLPPGGFPEYFTEVKAWLSVANGESRETWLDFCVC